MSLRFIAWIVLWVLPLLCAPSGAFAASASTTASRMATMSGVSDGVSKGGAAQQSYRSQSGYGAAQSGYGAQLATPAMRGYVGQVPGGNPNFPPQQQLPSAPSLTQPSLLPPEPSPAVGVLPIPLAAPPAWAQSPYPGPATASLLPFGAQLFMGNFSSTYHDGLQPQYVIMPGDRIVLRVWGAVNYDDVLVVDQQGNIFIPEVGPVPVGGLTHAALQKAVQGQVASVFTSNVDVYTNLLNTQPVAVFVTGHVQRPGRYAGGPAESILYYLDRAGGIVPERGSFRHITVKRGKRTIAQVDLYQFITLGMLPDLRLQDGDVILVENKGAGVAALGLIRQPARYEFDPGRITGNNLLTVAYPLPAATHVSVSGTRSGMAFNSYLSMQDFAAFRLQDEDIVEFHADRPGNTLMVGAAGAIEGASRFPVLKGTTLRELLYHVEIDPRMASVDALYIRRRSVAEQQKKAIGDALMRLEQSALTATSQSVDEANIRVREAELIQDFVKRASLVEPDGVVVVSRRNQLQDLILEEGDIVYVPQKSNVVQVVGEVLIPKAVVYDKGLSVQDYVKGAGGFSDRADRSNILVIKPNGEVGLVGKLGVGPGDQIMVMPAYDTKAVQAFKDIVQIIYQLAVSAGVVLVPLWR